MESNNLRTETSYDGEKRDSSFLIAQYQVLSNDRVNHNELFWNVPIIFLTAQAFLLLIALGGFECNHWERAIGAFISFVFGFLSIQIFERNRVSELSDAELMQDIEKQLLAQGYIGTEAHQKTTNRKYLNGQNVEKSLERKKVLKFLNSGVSYHLWHYGMKLVIMTSVILFFYNILMYVERNFPYLNYSKGFADNNAIENCLSFGSFRNFLDTLDKSAIAAIIVICLSTWTVQMLYKIYKTYPKRIARKLIDREVFRPIVYYFILEFLVMCSGIYFSIMSFISHNSPPSCLWLIITGACILPQVTVVVGIILHSLLLNKKKKNANDTDKDIVTVILAGGRSLRLRPSYPDINKFLNIFMGDQTLLETTLNRNWKFVSSQTVITTREFSSEINKLLKNKDFNVVSDEDTKTGSQDNDCKSDSKDKTNKKKKPANELVRIITEPIPMGTASAIYFYLWKKPDEPARNFAEKQKIKTDDTRKNNPDDEVTLDPIIVILPSDHVIPDLDNYTEAIKKACSLARDFPNIYLLGLRPTSDSDLYGHIVVDRLSASVLKVKDFKEKPGLEEIATLKEHGMVLWNMGVFIARRTVFLRIFNEVHWPNLSVFSACNTNISVGELNDLYKQLADSPFDTDILQQMSLDNLYVIPASFNWIDVGDPARLQGAIGDTLCKINRKTYDPNSAPVAI